MPVPRCTHKFHRVRHPKCTFPKGFRSPTTAALKIIYVSKGTPGEKKKKAFCWLRAVLSGWLLDYSLEVDRLSRRLYHHSGRWVIRHDTNNFSRLEHANLVSRLKYQNESTAIK